MYFKSIDKLSSSQPDICTTMTDYAEA